MGKSSGEGSVSPSTNLHRITRQSAPSAGTFVIDSGEPIAPDTTVATVPDVAMRPAAVGPTTMERTAVTEKPRTARFVDLGGELDFDALDTQVTLVHKGEDERSAPPPGVTVAVVVGLPTERVDIVTGNATDSAILAVAEEEADSMLFVEVRVEVALDLRVRDGETEAVAERRVKVGVRGEVQLSPIATARSAERGTSQMEEPSNTPPVKARLPRLGRPSGQLR